MKRGQGIAVWEERQQLHIGHKHKEDTGDKDGTNTRRVQGISVQVPV